MKKKFLKRISTQARRVHLGTTEGIMFDPEDPDYFRWYKIQLKIFGLWWVTVEKRIT